MKKQTHPNILRLDSEDERNASGATDDLQSQSDDAGIDQTDDKPSDTMAQPLSQTDAADFKKPLPPSESRPIKRKHKKHNSNGNNVISREDALILVPDGVQNEGFTFIRTPKGSDNENSDTEVIVVFSLICCRFFCV